MPSYGYGTTDRGKPQTEALPSRTRRPARPGKTGVSTTEHPGPKSLGRAGRDFSQVPTFRQPSQAPDISAPFKATGTSGGLAGISLDVTFTVSGTPATSLQAIQTFMGTRRTDGVQVGTYSWKSGTTNWDAFVDGGKNSPYVKLEGNAAAHATKPYYLTADEVSKQVTFAKDKGTIRIFDAPGAAALHEEAHFETAVVAVDGRGTNKDKVLTAFKWGWTGKGTKPDVKKGSKIDGKDSGIQVSNGVTPEFKKIVKHDYSSYDLG